MDKPKRIRSRIGDKAHIRATNKYNATHTTQLNIKLNLKTDADIVAHMETVENKRSYILGLIRADMKKNPG